MILYFDTSALVKLFSIEKGSDEVKALISDKANQVWALELVLIELICAVYRKFRNHELPEEILYPVQEKIKKQIELFNIIPLDSDTIQESQSLIERFGKDYGQRTLDALHIAGFIMMAETTWRFVSSDINQVQAVKQLNFPTILI